VRRGFIKGFSAVGMVKFLPMCFFTLPKNVSIGRPLGKNVYSATDATITAGIDNRYAVIPVARNKITEK
jgi:hypothetical protein